MCLNPQTIDNPYYKQLHKNPFAKFHNTQTSKITVPCGHCPQCIANKQMQLVQRVQMESLEHYLFFIMLSYNQASLPRLSVFSHNEAGEDIELNIPYADIRDIQNMFKRLRKSNALTRPFKYFGVSERGGERGRPHFHLQIYLPKYSEDNDFTPFWLEDILKVEILKEWRRNYGSTRKPDYRPLLTYKESWQDGKKRRNYDCHYVDPFLTNNAEADVAFYTLKYMFKASRFEERLQQALRLNLDDDYYRDVWSILKSRYFKSIGFGLGLDYSKKYFDSIPSEKILDHIKRGVDFGVGNSDYPIFINPISGQTFPLARFYKNKPQFFDLFDAENYFLSSKSNQPDMFKESSYSDASKAQSLLDKFNRNRNKVSEHSDDYSH